MQGRQPRDGERCRRTPAVVAAAIVAVALGLPGTAAAAGPQATVFYPVTGSLSSSPHESPPHHHFWGNFAIDAAAGAGSPVYARFGNVNGNLSLSLGGSFEPCASAGTGGSGLIVNVAVNGQQIGRVYYAHLSGITQTSGPIANGAQIGTLYTRANHTSCWQGAHVHVEPKSFSGTACFVGRPLNSGVGAGTPLGVIGGGYTGGDNQTCPPGAETPGPPGDGSFVRLADGRIFRIVGGAPIHVHTCAPLAGCPGVVQVANLDDYRSTPRDGAFVRVANGHAAGLIARAAGGHFIGLATCAPGGIDGCPGFVEVDSAGFFAYHAAHPHVGDGAFVRVANGPYAGLIARAAGGHLIGLATCAPAGIDGCPGHVNVDQAGFEVYQSGHPAVADGTFVRVANGPSAGLIARAAGTRLLGLTDCAPLGGCAGLVQVDQAGFAAYQEQHPSIRDGTRLLGLPSQRAWSIFADRRSPGDATGDAIAVNDATIAGIPMAADDPAPPPPAPIAPAPVGPTVNAPPPAGTSTTPTAACTAARKRVLRAGRRLRAARKARRSARGAAGRRAARRLTTRRARQLRTARRSARRLCA